MASGFDPYKILGIERTASWDQIEAAYRERVMKYHPDRGGDAWAFQQVQEAYEQIRATHGAGDSGPKRETTDTPTQKAQTNGTNHDRRGSTNDDRRPRPEAGPTGRGSNPRTNQARADSSAQKSRSGKPDPSTAYAARAAAARRTEQRRAAVWLVGTATVLGLIVVAFAMTRPRTANLELRQSEGARRDSLAAGLAPSSRGTREHAPQARPQEDFSPPVDRLRFSAPANADDRAADTFASVVEPDSPSCRITLSNAWRIGRADGSVRFSARYQVDQGTLGAGRHCLWILAGADRRIELTIPADHWRELGELCCEQLDGSAPGPFETFIEEQAGATRNRISNIARVQELSAPSSPLLAEPKPVMAPAKRKTSATEALIARLAVAPEATERLDILRRLAAAPPQDRHAAVDAVTAALDDVAPNVRQCALECLSAFGADANTAVPTLVAQFRAEPSASKREQILQVLGETSNDSNEGISLLIDVVRGASSGKARMQSKKYTVSERMVAISALSRLGPKAERAVPVLLDILKLSAQDMESFHEDFRKSADALARIGVSERGVATALKKFREGKGIRPAKAHLIEQAIAIADTALKRLDDAGPQDAK